MGTRDGLEGEGGVDHWRRCVERTGKRFRAAGADGRLFGVQHRHFNSKMPSVDGRLNCLLYALSGSVPPCLVSNSRGVCASAARATGKPS